MIEPDPMSDAHAALDAALAANGSERYVLMDAALRFWREAKGRAPMPTPSQGKTPDAEGSAGGSTNSWKALASKT